jgi:hypothetical protein
MRAYLAAMADPDRNPNFRRRWAERPPPKRERPRLENGNGASAAHNIKLNQQHRPLRGGRQSRAPLVVIRRVARRWLDPRRGAP